MFKIFQVIMHCIVVVNILLHQYNNYGNTVSSLLLIYILHSTKFGSKNAWHIAALNILVEKTLAGLAAMYGIY